ncbi:MAG: hypothetical protein LLF96_02010 [Eubacteriales bacterium]|nr:hypothetical protein [Eubacteriales bacterium]
MKRNSFKYFNEDGNEYVRFITNGKYKYEVIVDKRTWDSYLFKHNWTVCLQGNMVTIKTSIKNQSYRLWRMIVENEKDEIEWW